jgi:dipeptidyl aminopeptidase/acylaminoacyl peptidase
MRTQGNLERIGFDPTDAVLVGNPTPITSGSRQVNNFDVSPTGEYILLEKSEPSEDLSVMRPDGTGERRLWPPNDWKERDARFSPDGSTIAFRSNRDGQFDIWVVPVRGGTPRKVVAAEPGESLWHVTWSPSGDEIWAFDGGSNISYAFTLAPPAAQPGRRRVTDEPAGSVRAFSPSSFSLDGKHVAGYLMGDVTGGLVLVTVGEPAVTQILDFGISPEWLADGRRVLVRDGISSVRASGMARGGDLYVVDLDTRVPRLLMSLKPDSISDFGLSPDQQTLYFIRHRIDADIYTLEQRR